MTSYKEIKGQTIQNFTTDPSDKIEGQIWYNTTSQTLKTTRYFNTSPGVWSTSGNLGTAKYSLGGAGTQTEALAFGGGPGAKAVTEEYNGTSWTAGGSLASGRSSIGGTGTQNAALAFGGSPGPLGCCTEEYNGSTWTSGGAVNTRRQQNGGAGTQNAALMGGGAHGGFLPGVPQGGALTEEYDGSTWTVSNNMSFARGNANILGTQNAALATGGTPGPGTALTCVEEYNGTSWTTGGSLKSSKNYAGGFGTQNAAAVFAGTAISTEEYNGTTWLIGNNMNSCRGFGGGAGTQTAGLGFGGYTTTLSAATEEYDALAAGLYNKTITVTSI